LGKSPAICHARWGSTIDRFIDATFAVPNRSEVYKYLRWATTSGVSAFLSEESSQNSLNESKHAAEQWSRTDLNQQLWHREREQTVTREEAIQYVSFQMDDARDRRESQAVSGQTIAWSAFTKRSICRGSQPSSRNQARRLSRERTRAGLPDGDRLVWGGNARADFQLSLSDPRPA